MQLTRFAHRSAIRLAALLALAGSLGACNDIPEDERFIDVATPVDPTPVDKVARVTLLEEFTGQWCVNCPAAHSVIAQLLQTYPEDLIAVSIHAGGDAFSIGEGQYEGVVGLRNSQGEALAKYHGVNSFPNGVVNRRSGVITSDKWATAIYNEAQSPAPLSLSASATFSNNNICIEVTADPTEDLSGALHVWVAESGITAIQAKPNNEYDDQYVHNHVFRCAVTPLEGQAITLAADQPQTTQLSVAAKDNWATGNLSVIAFVTDSNGVAQATECHVISE